MFNNLKVSTRLYFLVGLISLFLVGIGVLGLKVAGDSNEGLDTVYKDSVVPLEQLKTISDMYAVNVVDTSHKVRNNTLKWEGGRKNVDTAVKTLEEKMKAFQATIHVAEEEKLVEELVPLMKTADAAVAHLREILKNESYEELTLFTISELYPAIDPVTEKLSDLVDLQLKVAKAEFDKSERKYASSRNVTIAVILFGIFASILLAFMIIRNLTRQLGGEPAYIAEIARRVAEGDLSISFEDGAGATGVYEAMKIMSGKLKLLVGNVKGTAESVASAADEIAASTVQLAKAAHSQSSAAEETSSTMVQMAASIKVVANNAESLAGNAGEVSSSVQELGASSEQVAKSAEVMASSVSETSATIEQMTVSIEKVAKSTEELDLSVSETSTTIEQMTVSIGQVSDNAQELQKVVSETATAIEQMAGSIRQVSKNVGEADDVAKIAASEGAAGLQAGEAAVTAMARVAEVIEKTSGSIINLGKRSEEIGDIVRVINEIADQTNLLALNAAIEAARAGDAGRGFAVVAEEVRKLAERSVAATKEIAQVIKQVQADTVESVKYGEIASKEAQVSMEMSSQAGSALESIVKSIDRTSVLMSDVARMTGEQATASARMLGSAEKMSLATDIVVKAAREQATGGRQIRIAVEKMNHITREVTGATREQAQGGRQIRIAVENMNSVTQQVTIAAREQSLSARQISDAVTGMNAMTLSVANATAEQKKGGEMVVSAVENISDITRENLSSVEQLSKAAQKLSGQAGVLTGLVAQFRVE